MKKKKTAKVTLTEGRVYVTATFNNTLVSITDKSGNVLFWGSAGAAGFRGARKSTPFAANSAIETVAKKAKAAGLSSVEVYLRGPGPGRDAAVRTLRAQGLAITMISDVTPIPHNGVRPKKKRRV